MRSSVFFCIALALLNTQLAQGQSVLPPCKGSFWFNHWDGCVGAYSNLRGDKYVGEWRNREMNGFGTITSLSGNKYVGMVRGHFLPNGEGSFAWSDGSTLKGTFLNGVAQGDGVYNFADGRRYEGQFKDSKANGRGTFTWPNGDRYVGDFVDDERTGRGEYFWRAGGSYEGDFVNGARTGQGIDKIPDGSRYVGTFRNNLWNGDGVHYLADGSIKASGEWSEGRLIKDRTQQARNELEAKKQEILSSQMAEMRRKEEERLADEAERQRIEREGDGSEDDLVCKARKLKPSTDPYKRCRDSLATAREVREERERLLAEKRYQENIERERQARISADRKRAQEETRERRREEAAAKDPYFYVKEQCRELGFKDKTEKFGTCVLELSKRGGDQQTRSEPRAARGDGTPDEATCVGYGYSVGSTGYADCRMKLDQARRDYERELRAYQAEQAAYEQRVAEGQAEARRRQKEKQAQYGFCVAACSSQPGSTALGCMSRCGAASAGLSFDPGAPPARPSGRTTYVINGRIINCNTSPSGSIVTCN